MSAASVNDFVLKTSCDIVHYVNSTSECLLSCSTAEQEQREQWVGCKERMIFLLHVGWENGPSIAASLPG